MTSPALNTMDAGDPVVGRQRISPTLVAAMMILLTLIAYWPSLSGQFVWDDAGLISESDFIKAGDGLYRFWFTTQNTDYFPVTSTSWWLEWRLWGANPRGYHATNLLLHAVNVVLLWLVLNRIGVPVAWLAALLFALHPVNVPSVAWISERKNTLSLFFSLLSLLAWFRFEVGSRRRAAWYGMALILFVLALLSKTSVVMLPFVLVLVTWWQRREIGWRDAVRVAPFLAASCALGLVTVWFQYHHAIDPTTVPPETYAERLASAGCAVWFYLYKAVVPLNLNMIYPRWDVVAMNPSWYAPALLLVVAFVAAWRYRTGWGRAVLFGLGCFVLILIPVLGFFKMAYRQYAFVADHWQYPALAGMMALISATGWRAASRRPELTRWLQAAGLAIVVAFGLLTWQRCGVFQHDESLWEDTLRKNPDAWIAHNNLGVLHAGRGDYPSALASYERMLQRKPRHAKGLANAGNALASLGRLDEAIAYYTQSLQIRPDLAAVHNNLGLVLLKKNDLAGAMKCFNDALQVDAGYAWARINLADALRAGGRAEAALREYEIAVNLAPDLALARFKFAEALMSIGEWRRATHEYTEAIVRNPGYVAAHAGLARSYAAQGDITKAINHWRFALKMKPDDGPSLMQLSWVLATHPSPDVRHGPDAVRLAKQAVELTDPPQTGALDVLAAAYAAQGQFDLAIQTGQHALDLVRSAGMLVYAQEVAARLETYRRGSPWTNSNPITAFPPEPRP